MLKFLVPDLPGNLEDYPHDLIRQGYLAIELGGLLAEVRCQQPNCGAGLEPAPPERLMAFRLRRREPVPDGIRRVVRECLSEAVATLGNGSATSDLNVHEARKRFKKVRATLRLVRDELGSDVFDRENKAMRGAGRPLSEVRDAKVLIERLDALNEQFKGCLNCEGTANLRTELIERRRAARAHAIGRTDTLPSIVRDCLAVKRRTKRWRLRRRGWKTIETGVRDIYKQARDAMRSAHAERSDIALHEWRKRTKDFQHVLELLHLRSAVVKRLAKRTHRLTELLGEDHDLAVLRMVAEELTERGTGIGADSLMPLIDERRRNLRQLTSAIGEHVYENRPRAFVRDLRRHWRRSRHRV